MIMQIIGTMLHVQHAQEYKERSECGEQSPDLRSSFMTIGTKKVMIFIVTSSIVNRSKNLSRK